LGLGLRSIETAAAPPAFDPAFERGRKRRKQIEIKQRYIEAIHRCSGYIQAQEER